MFALLMNDELVMSSFTEWRAGRPDPSGAHSGRLLHPAGDPRQPGPVRSLRCRRPVAGDARLPPAHRIRVPRPSAHRRRRRRNEHHRRRQVLLGCIGPSRSQASSTGIFSSSSSSSSSIPRCQSVPVPPIAEFLLRFIFALHSRCKQFLCD